MTFGAVRAAIRTAPPHHRGAAVQWREWAEALKLPKHPWVLEFRISPLISRRFGEKIHDGIFFLLVFAARLKICHRSSLAAT